MGRRRREGEEEGEEGGCKRRESYKVGEGIWPNTFNDIFLAENHLAEVHLTDDIFCRLLFSILALLLTYEFLADDVFGR